MGQRPRSIGLADLGMLTVVLIWGSNFAIAKSALAEFQPLVFGSLRFFGATLLLFIFTWFREGDLRIPRRDWAPLLVLGFVGNCVYQLLFVGGLSRTTASNSGLILGTAPIFVALLGTAVGSEKLYARNWLGILLSFVGLFLLVTGSGAGLSLGSETLVGDIMTLGATAAWATYTVLFRRMAHRTTILKASAWTMAVAVPFLFLAGLRQYPHQNWQAVSLRSWISVAYSMVFALSFSYVVWNSSVKRVGSARTSIYSYLTPLVSVVVAWILLGEAMKPLQGLGALFSLSGVALARHHKGQVALPRHQ